jgi:hypothetical protein
MTKRTEVKLFKVTEYSVEYITQDNRVIYPNNCAPKAHEIISEEFFNDGKRVAVHLELNPNSYFFALVCGEYKVLKGGEVGNNVFYAAGASPEEAIKNAEYLFEEE